MYNKRHYGASTLCNDAATAFYNGTGTGSSFFTRGNNNKKTNSYNEQHKNFTRQIHREDSDDAPLYTGD